MVIKAVRNSLACFIVILLFLPFHATADTLVSNAPCQAAPGANCPTLLTWDTSSGPIACVWLDSGALFACGEARGSASWPWTNSTTPHNFLLRAHASWDAVRASDNVHARTTVVAVTPGYGTYDEYAPFRQNTAAWINATAQGQTSLDQPLWRSIVHVPSKTVDYRWGPVENRPGLFNHEWHSIRTCRNGEQWAWLDRYAWGPRTMPDVISFAVNYHRVLLDGVDISAQMIANCGSDGQPYAKFNVSPNAYRLQVWGAIANQNGVVDNTYFWDANWSYNGAEQNACWSGTGASKTRQALKLVEAWWDRTNGWDGNASGATDGNGPTGEVWSPGMETSYGRAAGIDWNHTRYAQLERLASAASGTLNTTYRPARPAWSACLTRTEAY
jgi:hypothetical protein